MRKGVINLVNCKLCSLRVRDLNFLSIHIFSYPCTSRISFRTPVPQGSPLRLYLTKGSSNSGRFYGRPSISPFLAINFSLVIDT